MKALRVNFFFLLILLCSIVALMLLLFFFRGKPEKFLPDGAIADRIVVEKSSHIMTLFRKGIALKAYPVTLGKVPGKKERQGDNRTPEGNYIIDGRHPRSKFYLALHISYPNAEDRKNAQAHDWAPGGDIMIHGLPPNIAWVGRLHRYFDFTAGCIQVTNQEMEELWRAVPMGTPIEIRP